MAQSRGQFGVSTQYLVTESDRVVSDTKVYQLLCDLCIDFEAFEPRLVNKLIEQLVRLRLRDELDSLLSRIEGVPELWSVESLPKAWQLLLDTSELTKLTPDLPQRCTDVLTRMMRFDHLTVIAFNVTHMCSSPYLLQANLSAYIDTFVSLNQFAHAAVCAAMLSSVIITIFLFKADASNAITCRSTRDSLHCLASSAQRHTSPCWPSSSTFNYRSATRWWLLS